MPRLTLFKKIGWGFWDCSRYFLEYTLNEKIVIWNFQNSSLSFCTKFASRTTVLWTIEWPGKVFQWLCFYGKWRSFIQLSSFTISLWEFFNPQGNIVILDWNFVCSDLEVDYESEESASIVYAALAVDKEVIFHMLNLCLAYFNSDSVSILSDSIYNCSCNQIRWRGRCQFLMESFQCKQISFFVSLNCSNFCRRMILIVMFLMQESAISERGSNNIFLSAYLFSTESVVVVFILCTGTLRLLRQDFFEHHIVHLWMYWHLPQKQLKNSEKEWNCDHEMSCNVAQWVKSWCLWNFSKHEL